MSESAQFARRGFTGAALPTTLATGITAGATSFDLTDGSTWAAADDNGPFRGKFSDGTTEEEWEATTISGNTVSGVTRGVGGTSAASWSATTTEVEHVSSIRDFDEANYWVAELAAAASAANQVLVTDNDNSLIGLAVAASRILGRKATGDIDDLTAAEVLTILGLARTGFDVRRAASQTITTATLTAISWDTSVSEDGGDWWSSGAVVTVPASCAGAYAITGGVLFNTGDSGGTYRFANLERNGSEIARASRSVVGDYGGLVVAKTMPLAVGDTLEVNVQHDAGADRSINAAGTGSVFLSAYRVSA